MDGNGGEEAGRQLECRAGNIISREFRAGYGRLGRFSSLAQTPMCRAHGLSASGEYEQHWYVMIPDPLRAGECTAVDGRL